MSFRVKDVYANRSVLLTGGTGFLGKVIVEKILWAIPNVGRIYMIIRSAKGKTPKERLEKLLEDPLFNRLRSLSSYAELIAKLIPVEGDLMQDSLGLSPHDMQRICDDVSIVIHSAATVKFDEQLRDAVEMNVLGTTRMVALCHKMRHLKVLVHVSTAYANCDLRETEEKLYTPPMAPQKLLESLEWMDDDMVKMITPKLLGERPNTYTLTKALAETQLFEDAVNLPVIVIRPSIVGATWKDPLPGWTDNINGPTGIFAGVGKGVLTNMCGSVNSKADIIPVDIVANMIIVAGSHRASIHYDHIPIMHCASGDLNPLYWQRIVHFLEQFYHTYPFEECFGVPSTWFHTNRMLFEMNYYVKHLLPAFLLDVVAGATGQRRKYIRLYGKVWKMMEALHYFTTRGWTFKSTGLPKLWDSMHTEDQETFNFDVRKVNWDSYLFDYVMGVKLYILKEKLDNVQQARRNLTRLRFYKTIANAVFWYAMVRLFGSRFEKRRQWLAWFLGFVGTHIFTNYNFRKKIPLKSLEEYKRTALKY